MIGSSSERITSCAVVNKRFPNSPPGWNCAKSCGLKLRTRISAIAKASPMTRAAVVELVGARLRGHASFSTHTFKWAVEYFANNEFGLALIPIIGIFM